MKKILAFFAIIMIASFFKIVAKTVNIIDEAYKFSISYNSRVQQGDPVFICLECLQNKKKNKAEFCATSSIKSFGDTVIKADFYKVKNVSDTTIFLVGMPLSTYQKAGRYTIVLSYNATNKIVKNIVLPLTVIERDFFKETIPLNATNTAIKTDSSTKRLMQIQKLNDILFTTNTSSIYQTSCFISPTDSTRYTAHFGDRRIYTYTGKGQSTSLHYGNDYGVPTGTKVKACARGLVVLAEERVTTGYSVVIEHLPGLYSLYYHMESLNVKEDDIVEQGEIIGQSGATGLATGPHLHWEMRLLGQAVRPEFFLNDFSYIP